MYSDNFEKKSEQNKRVTFYYYYNDNVEYLCENDTCVLSNGKSISTIFIEILNNKDLIYKELNRILTDLKSKKNLKNIDKYVVELMAKYSVNRYKKIENKEEYNYIEDFVLGNVYSYLNEMLYKYSNIDSDIDIKREILINEYYIERCNQELKNKNITLEEKNNFLGLKEKSIKNLNHIKGGGENWKILDYMEEIESYFKNIKNKLDNFSNLILSDINNKVYMENLVKFDLTLPKHSFKFAWKVPDCEYIYIINDTELISSVSNVLYIDKYCINDLNDFFDINIYNYLNKKFVINVCKNCNKYFLPDSRNDEKYCSNISPQNSLKTCKELGAKLIYKENLKSDKIRSANYNVLQYYRMKIKREKDENKKENYLKLFEKYKKEYEKNNHKYLDGKLDEDCFIEWINKQKNK